MNDSVGHPPYSVRLRRYEKAKKGLTGLSPVEHEAAVKALADYYGI